MDRTLQELTDSRLGPHAPQMESHEPFLLFMALRRKERCDQKSLPGSLLGSQAGLVWLNVDDHLLEMRSVVSLDGQKCP